MTIWTPDTIRDLKRRLGMTWEAFADACGVSDRTVRYWVHRGTKPCRNAREKLEKLARKANAR
jgi:DNA-binding transcriptional regulator YiaG